MTQNGMSLKATRPMTPCCNLSLPCTHPRCPNRAKKRLCPSWLTGPQSTTVQEWRDEDDLGGLTVLDPSPGAAGGGTTEASWVVAGLAACDCLGNSGRGGLWIGGVFSSSKGTVGTGFESIAVAAAGKSACSASGTGTAFPEFPVVASGPGGAGSPDALGRPSPDSLVAIALSPFKLSPFSVGALVGSAVGLRTSPSLSLSPIIDGLVVESELGTRGTVIVKFETVPWTVSVTDRIEGKVCKVPVMSRIRTSTLNISFILPRNSWMTCKWLWFLAIKIPRLRDSSSSGMVPLWSPVIVEWMMWLEPRFISITKTGNWVGSWQNPSARKFLIILWKDFSTEAMNCGTCDCPTPGPCSLMKRFALDSSMAETTTTQTVQNKLHETWASWQWTVESWVQRITRHNSQLGTMHKTTTFALCFAPWILTLARHTSSRQPHGQQTVSLTDSWQLLTKPQNPLFYVSVSNKATFPINDHCHVL